MAVRYTWTCEFHGFREAVLDDFNGPAPIVAAKLCLAPDGSGHVCGLNMIPRAETVAVKATATGVTEPRSSDGDPV